MGSGATGAVATGRHSKRSLGSAESHPSGPFTLSEALQGSGPIMAHIVTSYLLDCDHAITCSCNHELGKCAYCWYCGTYRLVMFIQTQAYDTRGEAMANGPTDAATAIRQRDTRQ